MSYERDLRAVLFVVCMMVALQLIEDLVGSEYSEICFTVCFLLCLWCYIKFKKLRTLRTLNDEL